MNKKVLIGIVVALIVLVIALLWFGGSESKGLEYSLNADGASYSVTGSGICFDADLVIPSEHKGLPVTCIGESSFHGCDWLKSVIIPNSVKIIGEYAFDNCESLAKVVIPNSVTHIGDCAFFWCDSLKSIEIPNSVQSVGYGAFYYCSSLSNVHFNGTKKEWHLIRLYDGWNYEIPATKVICSDGTVSLK